MFRQYLQRRFSLLGKFATVDPKALSGKAPAKIHNFGRPA